MKRVFITFILTTSLFFVYSEADSQSTDSAFSFYPLRIGNMWEYHWQNYIGNPPLHLYYQKTEVLSDTVMQNGLHYFVLRTTYLDTKTSYIVFQRIDTSDGYIHQWADSTHEPAFAAINLRSTFTAPSTILGIPTQLRYTGLVDASWTLAYGFGIVAQSESGSGWPYRSTLIFARLNGSEYGTALSVLSTPTHLSQFELSQNYPNPFNPSTTIRFNLLVTSRVTLKIFTLLGQELRTLVSGNQVAGSHEVVFDATGLPSGVYFYRLQTKQFTITKSMVLAK